jgi:hypothetical protein
MHITSELLLIAHETPCFGDAFLDALEGPAQGNGAQEHAHWAARPG